MRLFWLFVFLAPALANAQEKPAALPAAEWRSITVTGEGEVKSAPDKADLTITLRREAKVATEAKVGTDKLLATLMTIAKNNGIEEKDIRAESVSLEPQYSYPDHGKPQLTGYESSQTIQLTIVDLAKVGAVMEALVKGGIDHLDNIAYGMRNEDALKEQALGRALDLAKHKAAMLAQNLGGQLGQAISVTESGSESSRPPFPRPMMRMAMAAPAAAAEAAPPPPGEIDIHSTLTASFELK